MAAEPKHVVERVQTGVRMEKRLLKVLRAFADYRDMTWAIFWKASFCTRSTGSVLSAKTVWSASES